MICYKKKFRRALKVGTINNLAFFFLFLKTLNLLKYDKQLTKKNCFNNYPKIYLILYVYEDKYKFEKPRRNPKILATPHLVLTE